MTTGHPTHRLQDLIRRLDRLKHRCDPSLNRQEIIAVITARIDGIELHVTAIDEALKPPKTEKLLQGRELWESLAIAVVGIARGRRSVRLNAADLKDLVLKHCPRYDLPFWAAQSAAAPVGLLRHEGWERIVENGIRKVSELRQLIEREGVLFWDMWEDSELRIVDSRWLEAHADIRRWVLTEWGGGRRCRFCACRENPHTNALLSVSPERRNGVQMIGDVVVLQTGGALTHDRCRRFWIEWCAIAAKYPSQQEAEAADLAAGRESQWDSFVETSALEAPADG
jgi:hypothetical protein